MFPKVLQFVPHTGSSAHLGKILKAQIAGSHKLFFFFFLSMSFNCMTERPILTFLIFISILLCRRKVLRICKSELTLFCTSQLFSQCYTPNTYTTNQMVFFIGMLLLNDFQRKLQAVETSQKCKKYYHLIRNFPKVDFINVTTISALRLVADSVKGIYPKMLKNDYNDYNPTWRPGCYWDISNLSTPLFGR